MPKKKVNNKKKRPYIKPLTLKEIWNGDSFTIQTINWDAAIKPTSLPNCPAFACCEETWHLQLGKNLRLVDADYRVGYSVNQIKRAAETYLKYINRYYTKGKPFTQEIQDKFVELFEKILDIEKGYDYF